MSYHMIDGVFEGLLILAAPISYDAGRQPSGIMVEAAKAKTVLEDRPDRF